MTPSFGTRLILAALAITSLIAPIRAAPRASLIASGDFRGVIDTPDPLDPNSSGIFALQVNAAGSFTARFVWQEANYRRRGTFALTGNSATFTVPKVGAPDSELRVEMSGFGTSVDVVLTEVENGVDERMVFFTVSGAPPDPTLAAILGTGMRTGFFEEFFDDQPETRGDGFSIVRITRTTKRNARFVGRMPDSEPYSTGSPLRADTYSLRSGLYKTRSGANGQVLGRSTVRNDASVGNLIAALQWHRQASRPIPPNGAFSHRVNVPGFRFYPSGERFPPIGLQTIPNNAVLRFNHGALAMPLEQPLTITIFGSRIPAPNTYNVRLQVLALQGRFKGSFVHPGTGERIPFNGAFQASPPGPSIFTGEGRGSFLNRDRSDPNNDVSGSVRIVPIRIVP